MTRVSLRASSQGVTCCLSLGTCEHHLTWDTAGRGRRLTPFAVAIRKWGEERKLTKAQRRLSGENKEIPEIGRLDAFVKTLADAAAAA